MTPRRLIVIVGQEGVGKSTIVRSLLPVIPQGAVLDGEDVGLVNPWVYDEAFRALHRRNVAAVVGNFWAAGYSTVAAGSFLSTHDEYLAFRSLLPDDVEVTVVHLQARKDVRDRRRSTRAKLTTRQWRDMVDRAEAEDTTLRDADGDYRYVVVDTSDLSVAATVELLKAELFAR